MLLFCWILLLELNKLNEVIGERLNKKYVDGREKLKIISDFFRVLCARFAFDLVHIIAIAAI